MASNEPAGAGVGELAGALSAEPHEWSTSP
jgi:hypothetical protein